MFPRIIALTITTLIVIAVVVSPAPAQWVASNGPYGAKVQCLDRTGIAILAGTQGAGLWATTDNGVHWSRSTSGLGSDYVWSLAVSGSTVLAGTPDSGVYRSSDGGQTWRRLSTGPARRVSAVLLAGLNLYAATEDSGIYRSTNNGTTWTPSRTGMTTRMVFGLAASGTMVVAATGEGVYTSGDQGSSWTRATGHSTDSKLLLVSGNTVYAGGGSSKAVYRSLDNGQTWALWTGAHQLLDVYALALMGERLYVGGSPAGVLAQIDSNNTLHNLSIPTNTACTALLAAGSTMYAGTDGAGIFALESGSTAWSDRTGNLGNVAVPSLAVLGSDVYAGTYNAGIHRSTDGGVSWSRISRGAVEFRDVFALTGRGGAIYAGTEAGVRRTSDNGSTWASVLSAEVWSFCAQGSTLYAGTRDGWIYRSTAEEASWTGQALSGAGIVHAIIAFGGKLFAGTSTTSYVSSDSGTTWSPLPAGPGDVWSLAASASRLYAGTSTYGILMSADTGRTWKAVNGGLPGTVLTSYYAVARSGSKVFAVHKGVYVLSEGDTVWTMASTGLPAQYAYSLAVTGGHLLVGMEYTGVFRRPLAEFSTSTAETHGHAPQEFALEQNYPNPFNPTTTISYRLAEASAVTMIVYNVMGQAVRTIDAGLRGPGTHALTIDASGLASGFYLYRLTAFSMPERAHRFSQSRKMLLLK